MELIILTVIYLGGSNLSESDSGAHLDTDMLTSCHFYDLCNVVHV